MFLPKQQQYRVKRGDTLWSIAQHLYGDPTVWPEVAKANGIPNGNFILIGMNLKLPTIQTHHHGHSGSSTPKAMHLPPLGPPKPPGLGIPTIGPPRPGSVPIHLTRGPSFSQPVGNLPVARAVLFPASKYKFDDLPAMTISTPVADYKVRLIGEISIQEKGAMAEIEFSKSGTLSQKLKTEYDSKLVKIAGQVKVKWDPAALTSEVSCGFTVATKINGQEFVSHQYDFTPPNKFKYTLKPKEISGEIDNLLFKGNLGYELEVTAKGPGQSLSPIPVAVPAPNRTLVWVTVGGLVTLGVAVIVADIAKDFGTLGVGLAESPLSWSAAMALFSQAAAMAH